MKKIAIIVPYAPTFLHFRGPLVKYLREQGHDLALFAPDWTPELRRAVEGFSQGNVESYPLDRTGVNPLGDLRTLAALTFSFLRLSPKVVLTFQPKPNVYGILAAALARVPLRAAVVEGLGFAFTPGEDTLKKRLVRAVLKVLYRLSFAFAHKVFFLNPDDLQEFVSQGLVRPEKAVLLGGIGVPLEEWPPAPPHLKPLTFTLIARLLKEKGVREFAEAARRVKAKHPKARFLLIGPLDTNPGAIPEEEVRSWVEEGVLEWIPWTDDVRPYLRQTSVYVLPSYREGVPRSTQEALAMARPVITTDAPGCRETVVDGVNGFLVPPRDPEALAEAMERFIQDPSLVERMGRESRKLAEERFDAHKINARLLSELGIK
ncbi:galactosyltransferase [Thermus thermophilus]|uniref:glycosyltransferase family 4 protein n=1 Tax=Thermus thermophilus TaxID=274 RepID=UPI00090A0BB0|nr:glycosyltransferase family 4 protein [Thermus thermophilus]BAW01137.1 galactosyltransferase [Thermus thermophilus]BDB11804.1 glycosyl transferase family 1 [Thermus thermophilus]